MGYLFFDVIMIQALIGRKIDQTQMFLENGRRIPVTEVAVSDNAVLQVKTVDKDKYTALQLGFDVKKKPTKALLGHAKKAGLKIVPSQVREVRVSADDTLPQAGEMVPVETVFKPGDIVDVTGTSKGKGFAGVVKRHHFRGGPKTHGQSDRHRAPGSIGQTTTPGRVYKGKRMAGHMGVETATVKNLTVVDVDAVNKKLYILGLIPGHRNAPVFIERVGEDKKFVPLLSTKADEVVSDSVDNVVVEEAATAAEATEATKTEDVIEEVAAESGEAETTAENAESVSSEAVTEEAVKEDSAQDDAKTEEVIEEVAAESGETGEVDEEAENKESEKKEEK